MPAAFDLIRGGGDEERNVWKKRVLIGCGGTKARKDVPLGNKEIGETGENSTEDLWCKKNGLRKGRVKLFRFMRGSERT